MTYTPLDEHVEALGHTFRVKALVAPSLPGSRLEPPSGGEWEDVEIYLVRRRKKIVQGPDGRPSLYREKAVADPDGELTCRLVAAYYKEMRDR